MRQAHREVSSSIDPIDRLAPFVFLTLWSGGYSAAKIAIVYCTPLTLVAVRFCITCAVFVVITCLTRAPWPRRPQDVIAIAACGLMIQALYFSCTYLAFDTGMGAAALALLMALQPIITACIAGPLLGERVRLIQWVGLALGFIGVTLVIAQKLGEGNGTLLGLLFALFGLLSITGGTLFQKRFVPHFNLWTGGVIQSATAALFCLPLALLVEDPRIALETPFFAAMTYLVLGNSVIAVTLLNLMIRKGEASRVASLLYLVPGGAALIAWLVIGETMTLLAFMGLVVGASGVALVMRPQRQSAAV